MLKTEKTCRFSRDEGNAMTSTELAKDFTALLKKMAMRRPPSKYKKTREHCEL
jgi:hypothetical protein